MATATDYQEMTESEETPESSTAVLDSVELTVLISGAGVTSAGCRCVHIDLKLICRCPSLHVRSYTV